MSALRISVPAAVPLAVGAALLVTACGGNVKQQLGIAFDTGKLAHDLAGSVGIEIGRSRGLSR